MLGQTQFPGVFSQEFKSIFGQIQRRQISKQNIFVKAKIINKITMTWFGSACVLR